MAETAFNLQDLLLADLLPIAHNSRHHLPAFPKADQIMPVWARLNEYYTPAKNTSHNSLGGTCHVSVRGGAGGGGGGERGGKGGSGWMRGRGGRAEEEGGRGGREEKAKGEVSKSPGVVSLDFRSQAIYAVPEMFINI